MNEYYPCLGKHIESQYVRFRDLPEDRRRFIAREQFLNLLQPEELEFCRQMRHTFAWEFERAWLTKPRRKRARRRFAAAGYHGLKGGER